MGKRAKARKSAARKAKYLADIQKRQEEEYYLKAWTRMKEGIALASEIDGFEVDYSIDDLKSLVEQELSTGTWEGTPKKDLIKWVSDKLVRDTFNIYGREGRILVLSDAQALKQQQMYYNETGKLLPLDGSKYGYYKDEIDEVIRKWKSINSGIALSVLFGSL